MKIMQFYVSKTTTNNNFIIMIIMSSGCEGIFGHLAMRHFENVSQATYILCTQTKELLVYSLSFPPVCVYILCPQVSYPKVDTSFKPIKKKIIYIYI